MAKVVHGIVHTDLMAATDDRSMMRHVKYTDGTDYLDIDNGSVVKLGKYLKNDIYEVEDMAVDTDISDLVLITSPEVMYDARYKDLGDFYNDAMGTESQAVARAMKLTWGDTFSLNKEALGGLADPEAGDFVDRAVGNKLVVSATKTAATIGEIVDVTVRKFRTYYGITLRK